MVSLEILSLWSYHQTFLPDDQTILVFLLLLLLQYFATWKPPTYFGTTFLNCHTISSAGFKDLYLHSTSQNMDERHSISHHQYKNIFQELVLFLLLSSSDSHYTKHKYFIFTVFNCNSLCLLLSLHRAFWYSHSSFTNKIHTHLLKLWLQLTLKLCGSYIFWSTTIIRELTIEPG